MFKKLLHQFTRNRETDAQLAYDLWSKDYDNQPDNLMLALDSVVFANLLQNIAIQHKTIIDVGCGTGRHWPLLLDQHPAQLIGYDVSEGMLQVLNKKFPLALTYMLKGNSLAQTTYHSADLLISTLTIAHIENARSAMEEWDRVVKPGADIIITDYHPDILQKGGKRTFKTGGRTISVKNYIHATAQIRSMASSLGWVLEETIERKVDDSVKHFYEKQNALAVFEAYKGMPVIYGFHFIKSV